MGEERTALSRRDGSQHGVAEALDSDETGTVVFSIWDEDIEKVRKL